MSDSKPPDAFVLWFNSEIHSGVVSSTIWMQRWDGIYGRCWRAAWDARGELDAKIADDYVRLTLIDPSLGPYFHLENIAAAIRAEKP